MAIGVLLLLGCALPGWANIFVSNIKFNGATNSAILLPNEQVSISYILNEPATKGAVTVTIRQGTNLIRAMTAVWPDPGTSRGTNVLVWDGLDFDGEPVPPGAFSVTITASTAGYDSWTKITDDANPGNRIFDPYGIAINKNTNSRYYGRIYVGNAMSHASEGNGVYKLNADCSDADEGAIGPTDYPWDGKMISPWKIEVANDDFVYVNDWRDYGSVVAFDPLTATYKTILNSSNWLEKEGGDFANLSGPAISGTGTNTEIWMADSSIPSFGVVRWKVGSDGIVPAGDKGTCVIPAGADSDLSSAPFDVSVGSNGWIYVVQRIFDTEDPAPRVLCFPPYSGDVPNTNAIWTAGTGVDSVGSNATASNVNLDNAYGISVNCADTYVAVAVRGVDREYGGLAILDATNGDLITNLDSGPLSSYMDVAWDAVGNVYGTQEELWRAFSPPGTNQSTTHALSVIQKLDALIPPILSVSRVADAQPKLTLAGQEHVAYVIESSTNLVDWTGWATNYGPASNRTIELGAPETSTFYRAVIAH